MCPSYKWPVLLRCSQETQWEVTVLEMIPCEISLISFLHSTNLNPERSPAFCDLCDFQAVLLPRCGRTSCVSCRRRHGDGCQQSSRKLYTVSHPAPPHPEEWYQARRMLQASLVQVGTSENLNRAEPGKYLAVLVVPCCTLSVSLLYTVGSFCFLRIKFPLRFRRAQLLHGSYTFQIAQSWWQGSNLK